jgi:hypothetical protein
MFVFPGVSRFGRGGNAGIDGGEVSGGGVPAGWACNASPERARSRTVIQFFTFIPAESRRSRFVMMLAAAANKKNALVEMSLIGDGRNVSARVFTIIFPGAQVCASDWFWCLPAA